MFRLGLLLLFSSLCLDETSSLLLFPTGTSFQITFGISIPMESSKNGRVMIHSIGCQMAYALPSNITQLEPTIIPARSIRDLTLRDTYASLEDFIEAYEWGNGRECLLRSICEMAEFPLENEGLDVMEEIIHLLLTPSEDLPEASDSSHESVDELYHEAERLGKAGGDCIVAYPDCIKSPLESFTTILRSPP